MAEAIEILIKAKDQTAPGIASAKKEVDALDASWKTTAASLGKSFTSVGAGLTAGVTLPLGAAAFAITGMASDLAETHAKTGEIFGTMSDEVIAWSKTTAQSMGQSQQTALDAAATFGIFGKAAGLTGEDLADFSLDFAALASDLASFNNTSPEQAIDAIGAALRGESEPLRAYGVLLDDASLRQEALKLGLIETTKEALTPQQKVLAAQALIYAQTTVAQGDFARTSDGLANSQRILTAKMKDLGTELGVVLLPLAQKLVEWITKAVNWFGDLSPTMQRTIVIVGGLAAALGPVLLVLGSIISAVTALAPLLAAIGAVVGVILSPIGLLVAGIAAVVLGLGLLVKAWTSDWGGIQTKTKDAIKWIADGISGLWKGIGDWFKDGVKGINDWLRKLVDDVKAFFSVSKWAEMGSNIIRGIVDGVKNGIGALVDSIKDAARRALDAAKSLLGIHSPSTVAAREIGLPFAQGIGAGIKQGMPAAMRNATTNNYFSVELVGGASAGQDVLNSVQFLSALYG